MSKAAWYVLWTDGGKEIEISSQAKAIDKVVDAIAPTRTLPYQIDGKWEMKSSMVFPNYIFVNCEMDANVYHRLRGLPHVRGWLGVDSMWPTDVPAAEMERVLKIHAGADPSQLIDNLKVDRHKKRLYGTITICGQKQRVSFAYEGNNKPTDSNQG